MWLSVVVAEAALGEEYMRAVLFSHVSVAVVQAMLIAPPAYAQGPSAGVSSQAPQSATASDTGINTVNPAPAQAAPAQAPGPQGNVLGEVVVTARKRAENLQSVPIAATVLSGNELAKQNVVTIDQIATTVPGLHIDVAPSQGTAPLIAIRGQVQNDTLATLDPSVGVYVDGIYWSRAVGADAALADVNNLDVLKGPQGTLFGRNTTGGAIDIHTNDPNLKSYGGVATVTAGAYSEKDGGIVLNAPIIDDKLGVRVVYQHNSHDGYQYDTTTGQRLDSQDNTTIRVKVLAQPTEKLRILASYENFNIDQESAGFKLTYAQPVDFTKPLGTTGVGNLYSLVTTGAFLPGAPASPHSDDDDGNYHVGARTQTAGLTGSYDLGFGVLKLIGGYRKVNALSNDDLDGTAEPILQTHGDTLTEEYTGEAQLAGKVLDNRLAYAVGYYWFKESGTDQSSSVALPGLSPFNPTNIDGVVDNRSEAGYFQGTYSFTPQLSLTGGVRYTSDHKALISSNSVINAATGAFVCAVPKTLANGTIVTGTADQADCSAEFANASSDVDYTVSLDYQFTPAILGYLKVAHGYRAGGDNIRGSASVLNGEIVGANTFAAFNPETALNYEAGFKTEFFNHRLRVNGAGYYTDYSNIQRSEIIQTATGGQATDLINAAAGKIYGGELEAQAIVYDGLRLGASLSVIEASYSTFIDPISGADHSGEAFPYTPKIQYSLTGDYTHPAPLGHVNFHTDWGWQSTTTFDTGYAQNGTTVGDFPVSSIRQSPYGILNLRVSYDFDQPNVEVALFGRNVADKTYRTSALDFVDAGVGINSVQYGAPATYGVQLTYRFGS